MADVADIANEAIEHNLSLRLSSMTLHNEDAEEASCEDCGEEIPEERRKAAPWAKTCIDCQGIREMRQRR